jgi:hypothetical protein
MSEHAIMGSFKLWINLQKNSEHNHNKSEEIEEINLANLENIEELENENAVESDEDDQLDTTVSIENAVDHDSNSPIAADLQLIDSIIADQPDSEDETTTTPDSRDHNI